MKTITHDTTAEDLKTLREIAEREQRAKTIGAVTTLILIVLVIGWTLWANHNIEAEKQWCRNASPEAFVDQYQTRCAQYSLDPAIRARIDRILAGAEK